MDKKYTVKLYYSGYITINGVIASSESDAICKARNSQDNIYSQREFEAAYKDILFTLEPWDDIDTAEAEE